MQLQDIPGHPGKLNVIGTLGRGPGGLVLAGHMDTVPLTRGAGTRIPSPSRNGTATTYGLGISDMKGFIGIAIEAASQAQGRRSHAAAHHHRHRG